MYDESHNANSVVKRVITSQELSVFLPLNMNNLNHVGSMPVRI